MIEFTDFMLQFCHEAVIQKHLQIMQIRWQSYTFQILNNICRIKSIMTVNVPPLFAYISFWFIKKQLVKVPSSSIAVRALYTANILIIRITAVCCVSFISVVMPKISQSTLWYINDGAAGNPSEPQLFETYLVGFWPKSW